MKGATTVLFFALCAFTAVTAFGQGGYPTGNSTPGFITDFINNLDHVEEQLSSLEGAVPQEKFSWRPGEGVRSISEVYRHVTFGNYLMPKLMGFDPPAEAGFHMDLKKWDSEVTDKAGIASTMKASFTHIRNVAKNMTAADLEKPVNFFGTEMTTRGAMINALAHIHEHLGQSIAYARSNGIVPPWTQAEQKAEKEREKEKK